MKIAPPIRSTFVGLGLVATLLVAGARASFAQRVEPLAVSARSASADTIARQSAPLESDKGPLLTWGGVGGGVIGGAAGLFGGFLAGAVFAHTGTCSGEDCSLPSALAGAVVGESIGLAAGAHLGSRRRGNLAFAVLTSAGISAAGVLALQHSRGAAPVIMLAVPVLQLAGVLALER